MSVRVWVTRDEPAGGSLCAAVEACGLQAIHEPVLVRRAVSDARREIESLTGQDWLVLTSPYAARSIDANAARRAGVRIAVVGPSTEAETERLGLAVHLLGPGNAEGLFSLLAKQAQGRTVCYPRSSLVEPPSFPDGIALVSPILYETVPRAYDRSVVERVDVIAVASASAVRVIGQADKRFASIGPATSRAVRELGLDIWIEAPEPSFEALARAIADQLAASRDQRA